MTTTPRHVFTFGPTLARPTTHESAYVAITDAIQRGKVIGHVNVAALRTERPYHINVEATFKGLTPDEALDTLAIASARIGFLYGARPSTVTPIDADDLDRLRARAEQLVDMIRVFGWWERVCGAAKWLSSGADFRHSRDSAVRQVMEALAQERAARPAGPVRGPSVELCAADEIPGVKSREAAV